MKLSFFKNFDSPAFTTVFRVLSFVSAWRRLTVISTLAISNVVELFGLALLVPIFSIVLAHGQTHVSKKAAVLLDFEKWLGVGDSWSLLPLITIYIGLLIFKSAIVIAVTKLNANTVSDVTHSIRARLIRALLGAKWSYFVHQRVGRLNKLISRDASAVGETFDTAVVYCSSLLHLAMYLALAIAISWKLALYLLILGTTFFIIFSRLIRWSKLAAQQHDQEMNVLSSTFVDVLTNMKTIKAMALGNTFVTEFLKNAESNQDKQTTKVFSADFVREIQEPFIAGGLVIFLLLAAWHDEALPGGMVVLGVIFVRMSSVFYEIQKLHHRLAVRSVKLDGILRSISMAEEMAEPQGGGLAPSLKEALRLDDVDFTYPNGKAAALKNCSLTVPAGKTTVLIGQSGAGKTSLLDLVLGLHQPSRGQILVDGVPLSEIDLSVWRRGIGYVSQEINLFSATVRVNVALGKDSISDERIWGALALAGAESFVKDLPGGLDYKVGERGLALSGGQRQRISLARSLLLEPKILLFDEATSALDPTTEEEFCNHLKTLTKTFHLTILAVTHRPYWLQIADHVVRLERGNTTTGTDIVGQSMHLHVFAQTHIATCD